MGARRRVFPGAFKREAVERVASSGLFTSQVAQELGPHETVLRRWVRDLAPQATEPARRPIPQAAAPSPADLAAENARLRRENERLRMERDISKKGLAHLRSGLPMKFGFDDEHRAVWPVSVMCSALGLSASGHCAWRARPESLRAQANRALTDDIRLIHAESSGTYGAPPDPCSAARAWSARGPFPDRAADAPRRHPDLLLRSSESVAAWHQ